MFNFFVIGCALCLLWIEMLHIRENEKNNIKGSNKLFN